MQFIVLNMQLFEFMVWKLLSRGDSLQRLDFSCCGRCLLEPDSYLGSIDPLTSASISFAVVFGNLGAESRGMRYSQMIPEKELSH